MRNLFWFSRGKTKNCLKPFLPIEIKNTSFVMDFETASVEKEDEIIPVISTFALLAIKGRFTQEFIPQGFYWKDYDDLISLSLNRIIDTVKRCGSSAKNIDLWFNNSSKFDNEFFIDWLIENKFEQVHHTRIYNNQFKLLGGSSISFLELEFRYRDYKFTIRDLYRFTQLSVAKLGNIVGVKKLIDIGQKYYGKNFSTLKPKQKEEYFEYAKEDIHVLWKGFQLFHKFISLNTTKKTLPSYALEDWKEREWSKKNYLKIPISSRIKECYMGGYSNVNPIHKERLVEGEIKCYDINSAYPYAMMQKLPVVEVLEPIGDLTNYAKLYCIQIRKGALKLNLVPIVRDCKKMNTFYSNFEETINYWVWDIELEWIKKYYDNLQYEILEVKYFETDYVFTNYIKHWYEVKESSSRILADIEKGRSFEFDKSYYEMEKTVAKLMMNSLYGKFGQKPIFKFYQIMDDGFEKDNVVEIDYKTDEYGWSKKWLRIETVKTKILAFDKTIYEVVEVDQNNNVIMPDECNNIFISSYITVFVRCILYEVIYEKQEKFLYSDTDSIYCIGEIDSKYLDEFELGKWKKERDDNFFKSLGSKCYISSKTREVATDKKISKVVICGVNDYSNIYGQDIDTFRDGSKFAKNASKTMTRGKQISKVEHVINVRR